MQYSATVLAAIVQQMLIYLPLIVIGFYFLLLLCRKILKCAISHHRQRFDERPKVIKLIRIIGLDDHSMESTEETFAFDHMGDEDVEYEQFEESLRSRLVA